jgi:hypothetical protein
MTTLENKTITILETSSKTNVLKLNNKDFNFGKIRTKIGNKVFYENKIINNNEYRITVDSLGIIEFQPVSNKLKTIRITKFK